MIKTNELNKIKILFKNNAYIIKKNFKYWVVFSYFSIYLESNLPSV